MELHATGHGLFWHSDPVLASKSKNIKAILVFCFCFLERDQSLSARRARIQSYVITISRAFACNCCRAHSVSDACLCRDEKADHKLSCSRDQGRVP